MNVFLVEHPQWNLKNSWRQQTWGKCVIVNSLGYCKHFSHHATNRPFFKDIKSWRHVVVWISASYMPLCRLILGEISSEMHCVCEYGSNERSLTLLNCCSTPFLSQQEFKYRNAGKSHNWTIKKVSFFGNMKITSSEMQHRWDLDDLSTDRNTQELHFWFVLLT